MNVKKKKKNFKIPSVSDFIENGLTFSVLGLTNIGHFLIFPIFLHLTYTNFRSLLFQEVP